MPCTGRENRSQGNEPGQRMKCLPLAMLARVARLDKMPLRKPWQSAESLGIAPSSRVPPSERIALKTLIATLSGASAEGQALHTLLHSTLSEALGGWHHLPPLQGHCRGLTQLVCQAGHPPQVRMIREQKLRAPLAAVSNGCSS